MVSYQITKWMRSGSCRVQTSAASGLVADLQGVGDWLRTDTFLHPFCLREEMGEEIENSSEGRRGARARSFSCVLENTFGRRRCRNRGWGGQKVFPGFP